MAKGAIDGPFAVINSDDFYGREAYETLAGYYQGWTTQRENDYCMVGYHVENTLSEFGAVSRGVCTTNHASLLEDVVERTHIERLKEGICYRNEEGKLVTLPGDTIVSMNFWGFTPSFFQYLETGFAEFIRVNADNPKAEYYIPTAVNYLIKSRIATVRVLQSPGKWFGMTYREDRETVVDSIRALIKNGIYPENLWV
jgi:hypothetical protein